MSRKVSPVITDHGYKCPKCGAFCDVTQGSLMPYGYEEVVSCENCGAGVDE